MTWPFPANAQPAQRSADAPTRGDNGMRFFQVALEQGSGPNGRAIAVVARIVVDDCIDQRVNDSEHRCGPTTARSIQQALSQVQITSTLKSWCPVVNGLPTHIKEVSNLASRQPLVQSKQCMSALHHRGVVGVTRQCVQLVVFSRTELEGNHKVPPTEASCTCRARCQRTFVHLLKSRATQGTLSLCPVGCSSRTSTKRF